MMKRSEVTQQQFAQWLFEHDAETKFCYHYPKLTWSTISLNQKEIYYMEVQKYKDIGFGRLEWPDYILAKLEI